MNHYDEDHNFAITAALMGLSCEDSCGPLGILMHCAVLTLAFCAATIAITLPSATRKILKKVYNSADGTPDRSEEEMLQAHPQAAKLCRVHKALFSVAGAIILVFAWAQNILHLPIVHSLFFRVIGSVGSAAVFATAAVGIVLIAAALAARKKARKDNV